MYEMSKLSPSANFFLAGLATRMNKNADCIPLALSKVIANKLMMPSNAVVSPKKFYEETVLAHSKELISKMSDLFAFDTNRVVELTLTFWLARYNIVYPAKALFANLDCCSESSFMGYGSIVPVCDLKTIKDETEELVRLYNGFCGIVCDLCGADELVGE